MKTFRVHLIKPGRAETSLVKYVKAKNALEAAKKVDMYTGNYPTTDVHVRVADGEILEK